MRLRFGLKQLGEGFGLGLSLFVAAAFYALFVGRTAFSVQGVRYFTLVDDAMISMRYGRNLANGFGLVWNPGQPPVEGFTNMAWTLYMAVLHMLPISESKISLAVMLTSGVLLLVTAFVSFALCRAIAPNSKNAPLIASTITAFYFPLVFWSLRGMELALTTFLVYLVVLLWITAPKLITSRRAFLLSLLVLLAILVRFDTILQITIIIVSTLYETLFEQKAGKAGLVLLSPILMLYLAGIVGVLLFQLHYFGSIFPNTYYLKVEGVSLRERLLVGTQAFAEYAARDVLTLFFIAGLGPLILRDLRKTDSALLFALFLVQCVYSVYVGGDFAEPLGAPQVDAANRFITQGMPSLIILFSLVIDRVLQLLLTEVHGRV